MEENWIHYWSCEICGRIFPQNEIGAIIGTDISCCNSIICKYKFFGVSVAEWREFRKTIKYTIIFGCDPDLDREESILACFHVWNPEEKCFHVKNNSGNIVAKYSL